MRWFLVLIAAGTASAINLQKLDSQCDSVDCRAGRECIMSGGSPQCLCVTSCPDHDKPVCGSDGDSYDNYCLLHQRACLTGVHISVDHRGYCQKDIDFALRAFGVTFTTTTVPTTRTTSTTVNTTPTTTTAASIDDGLSVCYGPQRDALRNTIISEWQMSVEYQPWYTEGMTYRESLSGHFFSCDENRDYRLRPDELIHCFSTMPFLPRPEQDLTITRTLCTDALIESADNNRDWRLDFQEFTHLLDPLYHLEAKNCSLEGKHYTDGAEVRVECNHCVCATGSWVCASHNCPDPTTTTTTTTTKPTTTSTKPSDDIFGYLDTKYDLDDDDDDYYEDDEYYDDEDDDYIEEQAKKEYKSLSSDDKEKLTRLESNIKHFYSDVKKWEDVERTNLEPKNKDPSSSKKEEDPKGEQPEEEDDSEETSSEEEEDDLLDQYDSLLDKSEKVRDKLTSLRSAIHSLEERRRIHRLNRENRLKKTDDPRHYLSNGVHINDVHSNDVNHDTNQVNHITNHVNYSPSHVNPSPDHVTHTSTRLGKIHAANKKQQKQEAYRTAMRAKLERHRLMTKTDNDIWEDQWKAKIKKHHHRDVIIDNHL